MKAASQLGHVDGGGANMAAGGAGLCASQERLSALLGSVAAGDGAGMASLYDETSPVIFGLLRHMLGAGAEADAALLEVYSCVWRQAAAYRPEKGSALAWLVSKALECVSERGRVVEVAPADEPPRPSAEAAAGGAGTLPAYIDAEAVRAREAFGRLDPEQGEALRLSYFHGTGRLEATLGLSARETRALVSRGLRSYAQMFRGMPADKSRREANGL